MQLLTGSLKKYHFIEIVYFHRRQWEIVSCQLLAVYFYSLPKDNLKSKPTSKEKMITKECLTKPDKIINHDSGTSLD